MVENIAITTRYFSCVNIVLLFYIIHLHSLTLCMVVNFACIFSYVILNVFLKTSILPKYLSKIPTEYHSDTVFEQLQVLSCQPRVTVTPCFVYKVIRDLESIDHTCINLSAG